MSSEHTMSFQLHLTDSGLRSRTFSLKINKLPTFFCQGLAVRPRLWHGLPPPPKKYRGGPVS